jgi:exosortase D (VPLPA-CTERM-specific)
MRTTTRPDRHGGFAPGLALDPAGLAWLALAVVSTLPLFWFGLTGLAAEWARPEYSHGPIIPVLSFYMFLRETRAVPPAAEPVPDRWPGLMLIAAGLALALLGNLVRIDDLVFYALIVWIAGLILTGFGWRRGRVFWPSVLHLVFMLPLPGFLYHKINTTLQLVSSEIGVWFVRLLDVPVFLDGNIIDLGVYKLQVAEACSGLRYLFPIMSFSYVFAVLYRGPVWHKLVLLLSAVPIAVLMNSVRIGVIGVLVDRHGIAQAEGFLHVFEGWIIFLACIAILFGMVMLMQRLSGDPRSLSAAIDLDFSGLGHQLARVRTVVPTPTLVTAALMTMALSLVWLSVPSRFIVEVDRDPYSLFPMKIRNWTGSSTMLDPVVERSLAADDYMSAYYARGKDAAGIDLFASYYVNVGDGTGIHAPEICLPGQGWEIFSLEPAEISLEGTAFGTVTLNRAIIQKGLEKSLVYFWYEGRGRSIANDFVTRFYVVYDSLTRQRADGGLVRIITPITLEENEAAADARLQNFLSDTIDLLPRFIPE